MISLSRDNQGRLGLQGLSNFVSFTATFAEIDQFGTQQIGERYRSRLQALKAFLDEDHRLLLQQDLALLAVHNLSIMIKSESGHLITTGSVRAFKDHEGTLIVSGANSPFRGLGYGLARYVIDNPRLSATFETILSADNENEVIERLREQGIPQQEFDAIKEAMGKVNDRQQLMPQKASQPLAAAAPLDVILPEAAEPSTGPSITPDNSGERDERSEVSRKLVQDVGRPGVWDLQTAGEAGRHAEDWFYGKLTSALPQWTITRRERDRKNRETDFVLRLGNKAFHIEAKRLGSLPGLIFWPDLQFSKASELGDRYCLAVLLEQADAYAISWVWQPIIQLVKAGRYVEWVWDEKKIEQLQPGFWPPANHRPQLAPGAHVYRITVDDGLYRSFQADTPTLPLLKAKIQETR